MTFFPLCLYFSPCVFIFSPCVFIFSLVGHAINCSTFAGGVLGENIFCFSPWPCCMVFILPFFLDSFLDMSLRRNNIIFSPLVQFFSYLWQNNPDNCSFSHFFFSSILLPSALLYLDIVGFIQVYWQHSFVSWKNQQSDRLQCSKGCDLYLLSNEIQINNASKWENTI